MKGPKAVLTRIFEADRDAGTKGDLVVGDFSCKTLELPWKGNARGVSCIPVGTYTCRLHESPHFGWVFWVTNVPGRSEILIHPGNFAGDVSKGLRSDVKGCILVGKSYGELYGQPAILTSKLAMQQLLTHLHGVSEFELEVRQ